MVALIQSSHQLADVHVDQDPDLHRLERVALRGHPTGRRVDDDRLDRLLTDPATALVPELVLPATLLVGVDPRLDRLTARSSLAIPWSVGGGNIRSAYRDSLSLIAPAFVGLTIVRVTNWR